MSPQAPVENVEISATDDGEISILPPTFLERWGVFFVAFGGGWILIVGSGLLIYFLRHLPAFPTSQA